MTDSAKILVMDDEATLRLLAEQMLIRSGYDVDCVEDGKRVLDLYQKAYQEGLPYAAVILDVNIPGGMGGGKTLARLREFDPHVKAIVSSGCVTESVMLHWRQYGFVGTLPKPYIESELLAVLHPLLHRAPTSA